MRPDICGAEHIEQLTGPASERVLVSAGGMPNTGSRGGRTGAAMVDYWSNRRRRRAGWWRLRPRRRSGDTPALQMWGSWLGRLVSLAGALRPGFFQACESWMCRAAYKASPGQPRTLFLPFLLILSLEFTFCNIGFTLRYT